MKHLPTQLFCCLAVSCSALAQPVVLNEVMYHSAPAVPEDTGLEWIELFNPSTSTANLTGWRLDAGVSFAFAVGTVVPAGGYLVVAASLTNFQAHYPGVAPVVGDWVGRLSNGGEQIRLRDAEGETVDQVAYADSGDWAERQRVPDPTVGLPSWDWLAVADGAGRSMEVMNPALPNSSGQNWAPSATAGGTPGTTNSMRRSNIPAMILETAHFPAVPKAGQAVTITARLVDEQPTNLLANVMFRNATGASPPAFGSVPMADDGGHNDGSANDGLYGAILPAQTNGSVVEFYVQASDGVALRTWPPPALDGQPVQTANAHYQVDDTVYTGNQQVLRLVLTGAERQTLLTMNQNSDAQMNVTLISTDDRGSQIRYRCAIRIRGAGSRSRPTKNYRLNLPSDQPWNGLTAVNLNAQYPHAAVVGAVVSQKAGLPAANAHFVQVRLNGVNLARSGAPTGGDGASWGSYALMEPFNNEWANVHLPNDPNGNVYRGSSSPHTADLNYRGTNPATYLSAGYSKTSNQAENDWSDLINLTDALNNIPDDEYAQDISQRVHVQEWMTYFAVLALMEYSETALGSGEGDDFALYRGLADPRFRLLGHDYDTIFGQGDAGGNLNESIWVAADAVDQPAVNRFLKFPDFAPLYYQELYRLANGVFSPAQISPLFDHLLGGVATEPTITAMKNFAATRAERVLNQIPRAIRITNSLPVVNGYPTATVPQASLTGAANALRTRSVQVNGLPATWIAWRGAWNISDLPLHPGINRLLVQSFDDAGVEVERNAVDILYNAGPVVAVPASLTTDATWTAAGGPYQANNSLTVQSGVTLTIQPGATVFLGSDANLIVADGGRLIAEGTDTQPIVFTRIPGAGNWGGLVLDGSADSPETRIGYAHFAFNGDTAIHARDATVLLHHLTFGNAGQQYLSLDRASFVVQDCQFPAATSAFEPVHGTGGIKPGGRGIFLRNFFGRAMGYNDSVDFTGGNRPGPILQFINNVFTGSDDDLLDLDGTDAWVEGNIFLHVHRNGSPDSASAVSGGSDSGDRSEITIVGNLFYDVDQVANAKQGNFYAILNNTIVRQTKAGSQDPETGVVILADDGTAEGAGIYLEGNIIHDAEQLVRNRTEALVTFTNNLMTLDWSGPGGGNSKADPLLRYVPQLADTTNFTTFAAVQIFREWFSLQAGSPARGAGPNGLDQGGAIPLGASVQLEPDIAVGPVPVRVRVGPRRTGDGLTPAFPEGAGYTHYRWRLDEGPWSAETAADTELTLTDLAPGQHRIEVSGKRDSGDYQDDPVLGRDALLSGQSFQVLESAPASVVLNEILAANSTAFTVNGTFPDAIELLNTGGKAADVSGWGLSDELANKFKFVLPPGTVLEPGAFLLVLADGGATGPGLHAGFALDQRGETLSLFSTAGELVDQVGFGIQLADLSIGRDGAGDWTLGHPSIGSTNQPHAISGPSVLRINEWLANSRSVHPDDFIEIHNPSTAPVLLGGLFLTDEILGWPARHRVTPLTYVGPGAHFLFIADGEEAEGADHVNFKLAAERGSIGLLDAGTNVLDCVFYGAQTADVSEGRRPSGASAIAFFTTPSPGAPNPAVTGTTTVTNFSTSLLSTSAVWRYEQSGVDLTTTGWQGTNYVDAGWPQGPGVFGFDNDFQVQPYQTILTTANNKFTFYFRTTFVMPTNPAGYRLEGALWLDDGAVFYLNGAEATRIRMPGGEVIFTTRANNIDNALRESVVIPATRLVQGTNTLAVEVHQTSVNSGDVVWGLELNAVRSITNAFVPGVALNEVMARNVTFANAGGTNLADWIELHNPSADPFDLSGLSLTDDLGQPRRWVFPDGASLPAGAYLIIRCDPDASASAEPDPLLNTGFGLNSDEGDAVYLFDAEARGGGLLDSIVFGLQPPDYALGRVPDTRGNWVLTLPTPGQANIASALGGSASLVLNEWLANPSGNDSDFIELYNPLPQPVDLSALFLSDSLTNRTRSPIHPFSFIGFGENAFVRFVADGDVGAGADHVSFGLRGTGEFVALYSPAQELITSVAFGPQENGVSEGRFPNGSTNVVRFHGTSTPGRSNLLPLDSIAISEVLTHTSLPLEDAIELANVSATPVDVSGWYLTDNPTDAKRFRIPPGTLIPAGGHRVFYEHQFNPNFDGRPPAFALSSSGEELYLFSVDSAGELTGFRTGVSFGAAARGMSFGRYLTSVEADFTPLANATFGAGGPSTIEEFRLGTGAPNAGPLVGPVVISEIAYHPPDLVFDGTTNDNTDDEFVELLNIAGSEVVLSDPAHPTNTWRLRDAVDYEFQPGVILAAGGRLLVVGFDPATNATALSAFRARFLLSDTIAIHGPWRGRLANDGENVELYRPDAPREAGLPDAGAVPYLQVDRVKYADAAPWPALADGTGNGVGLSLHRRVETAYGNDPVNWVAGAPTPGTAAGSPPVEPPTLLSLTADHDVAPGSNDILMVTAAGQGPLSYAWRRDGALLPGATGPSLILADFQITNAGLYSVLVMNPAGAASGSTRVGVRSMPILLRQPQSVVTLLGGSVLFSVLAAGTEPLAYQWLKNHTPLAGATGAVLTLANVQGTDAAGYRAWITNSHGSITSTVANLDLNSVPIIVTQPRSTNVSVGANATLNVGVAGSPPLHYQWRYNAANITGATNATLTLVNVQLTNAGAYSVRVSNAVGSVLSTAAVVTVYVPPVISLIASDASASERAGDPGRITIQRTGPLEAAVSVNFSVSGTATPGSDYGVLIGPLTIPAGSSSVSLTVNVVDDAVREGDETVVMTLTPSASYVVGNPASATVTVFDNDNRPPQVAMTSPPDGLEVTLPAAISLSATAVDPDGSVVRVEFFSATTRLGQLTAAPYVFTWNNAVPGVHSLTAVATDNLGSTAVSLPVRVTVNAPPVISILNPVNGATLPIGSDISLLASAGDPDGSVTMVEFFEGGRFLASDATSPFGFVWNSVPGGEYVLTARATDNRGASTLSTPVVIIVGAPPARFGDHFANRGVLAGFTATIAGSTSNFTREAGEPRHDNRNGAHSGWLTWTAPASGLCVMDTFGSRFDTVLAVYTNSTLTSLVRVVSNDDANQDTPESQLRFNVVAGTSYQIALDGFTTNAQGVFSFHSSLPNPYPILVEQPQSQVVTQGTTLTLSVTAAGPGPLSYQWRLNNANLTAATAPIFTRPNVSAADQGAYIVVVSNVSGSVTSAQATVTILTPPTITTQPADQSVVREGEALFSVRASGLSPLTYQWRLNGSPIPGATSSNLALNGVFGRNEGLYSVVVSNPIGSVTSRDAWLSVSDGLLALRADALLSFTDPWRFHALGGNLGTDWRQRAYDDSGWSNGVGFFGLEPDAQLYPEPFRTPFRLTGTNGSPIVTFYLRTAVLIPDPDVLAGLLVTAYVDDGAVWYLNGREAGRVRMPATFPVDGVLFTNLATILAPEGASAVLLLPLTNAVPGSNTLAVEVHQTAASSTDVAFGMSLDSLTMVTNAPALLRPEMVQGAVRLTLQGVAGRNYAIEASTNLVDWTPMVLFTNFNGTTASFQEPFRTPGQRFYRGQLVPWRP